MMIGVRCFDLRCSPLGAFWFYLISVQYEEGARLTGDVPARMVGDCLRVAPMCVQQAKMCRMIRETGEE